MRLLVFFSTINNEIGLYIYLVREEYDTGSPPYRKTHTKMENLGCYNT